MKKVTSISAFILCASFLFSQVDQRFQNLDFTNCNTGHFWNQIPELIDLPDGSDYTMLNFNQTSVILHDFNKANIDENNPVVPDYLDLKESFFQNNVQDRVIPISILEMKFEYVSQSAVDNNFIFIQNEQIFQLPQTNVFAERDAVVLHIDARDAEKVIQVFSKMSPSLYHHSSTTS